jgi:hypothetical protein
VFVWHGDFDFRRNLSGDRCFLRQSMVEALAGDRVPIRTEAAQPA